MEVVSCFTNVCVHKCEEVMNEILLNEILNDYCKENNEISSSVKEGEFYAVVNCNLDSAENIVQLVGRYMEETNETLKLKYKKKSKSEKGNLKEKVLYRCHHDTRYEKTRDANFVYEKKPFKRFRNTFCPFQISFKVFKVPMKGFCCNRNLEHTHNHPINSLEDLSVKMLTEEVKNEVLSLSATGLTPSQAHKEFLRRLMDDYPDNLTFHLQMSDRSKCPRRRDFNSLYIKYCGSLFGGRNGPAMFERLEEKITSLKDQWEEASIEYQLYDKENNSAFILTIVIPLMVRVHKMVS